MANPNADDGLMPDITDEYKRDRRLWFQKAQEHTQKFSNLSSEDDHDPATNQDRTKNLRNESNDHSSKRRKTDDKHIT
jgi:hypothetical protein